MGLMDPMKVIARYRDGRILKGTSNNLRPELPSFHILPYGADPGSSLIEVYMYQLKAVFVVKTFEGNPDYKDHADFRPEANMALKLRVEFEDGEVMYGFTHSYDPSGKGFYMIPADANSNNKRVWVVLGATKCVERLRPSATGPASTG